jgi:large subunit ribosomal protein L6
MSRVGKLPITLPEGVTLTAEGNVFTAKGKLGTLSCAVPPSVQYSFDDAGVLTFTRLGDKPQQRADHGLARALVNNMVVGVSAGFMKTLELEGTGYKWEVRGNGLLLTVGYSHQVTVPLPEGITCNVRSGICEIIGIDKQLVGFVAAQIRRVRKVEPYKGKGIRYKGEFVRRKAGKAGA